MYLFKLNFKKLFAGFLFGFSFFLICLSLLFSPQCFGWSNGGSERSIDLRRTATKEMDILNYKNFSLNVTSIVKAKGYGFGTHDFLLEQAIAEAIKAGADVSWINLKLAQRATGKPDTARKSLKNYSTDHTWHGSYGNGIGGGTIPRAVGQLYREIVIAINKGQYDSASSKLGYLSHYIGDASSPFHVNTSKQFKPFRKVPFIGYHNIHAQGEYDLDYYMEYSISYKRKKWKTDVNRIIKYLPALNSVTDDTSPQAIREMWFGGSTPTAKKSNSSARRLSLTVAETIQKKYAKGFIKAWKKAYKKKFKLKYYAPGKFKEYKGGTKYLVQKGPKMLKQSADALGSIVYNLSVPTRRNIGIDQISNPKVKVKKKYKKKTAKVSVNIKIKVKGGKSKKNIPVRIRWYKGKKKLKTITRWTNKKGKITASYNIKRSKKKKKITVEVWYPTTNITKHKKIKRNLARKK